MLPNYRLTLPNYVDRHCPPCRLPHLSTDIALSQTLPTMSTALPTITDIAHHVD
jgi:hypothetical protein